MSVPLEINRHFRVGISYRPTQKGHRVFIAGGAVVLVFCLLLFNGIFAASQEYLSDEDLKTNVSTLNNILDSSEAFDLSSDDVGSEENHSLRRLGVKKKANSLFPDYPHLGNLGNSYKNGYFGTYPAVTPPPMPVPFPVPVPVPHMMSEEDDVRDSEKSQEHHHYHHNVPSSNGQKPKPDYVKDEIVMTAEAEFKCHSGFLLQGGRCVQYDQKPTKLGCRKGWKFRNGVCTGVDVEPSRFMCDEGFVEDAEKKVCVKGVRAPKQIFCPQGFHIGKEMCFRPVHTKADRECDNGYQFVGNECYKKEEVMSRSECPPGFHEKAGACRRASHVAGSPSCPHGYEYDGSSCMKVLTATALDTCPQSFGLENGECVKRKSVAARAECPAGGQLDGYICLVRDVTQPTSSCPAHTNTKKGGANECVSESRSDAEPYCRYGYYDSKTGMCSARKKQEKPEYRCPFGYLPIDKHSCVRKKKSAPQLTCPPAYKLDYKGKVCESVERVKPAYNCPKGYDHLQGSSECKSVERAPRKQGCPPGHTFNPNGSTCEKVVTVPARMSCDTGFSPTPHGQCMKVEVMQPDIHCPPNFQPSQQYAKDGNRHHNAGPTVTVCIGESRTPVIYTCPEDYERSNTDHEERCVGREDVEPQLKCPRGFVEESNGKCMTYDKKDPRLVCPEGYQIAANQCLKHLEEKPVVMCPVGYKLYDGVCVNQVFSKPKAICPRGYTFDHLVGQCYKIEVKYNFSKAEPAREALLDLEQEPEKEKEAVLDLDQTTTSTRRIFVQPQQFVQPIQQAPVPTTVQVIQQRIPIPQPVVYLPRQAPPPPPPMLPPPPPMPYPVPVPYSVPRPVEVVRERPIAVPVHVPVHHKQVLAAIPVEKKKKHSGGSEHKKFFNKW
eukprot:GHVQ01030546.1.p1 GENE.GHVQ01030546.1~~GHVQ01030546.1.p1  ORF type:complete len:888 (+),score=90.86 GHVQ01030546.1:540-3203(+)